MGTSDHLGRLTSGHTYGGQRVVGPVGGWQDSPLPCGPAPQGTRTPYSTAFGPRPCALERPLHPNESPHWPSRSHTAPQAWPEGIGSCLPLPDPHPPSLSPLPLPHGRKGPHPNFCSLPAPGLRVPGKEGGLSTLHVPSARSSLERSHGTQGVGQTLVWAGGGLRPPLLPL